jgi:hypothetical protein
MIHYERPPEPPDFRARVHDARLAVENAVSAGVPPGFPPLWQDYKDAFATAQEQKCAFCDRDATNHDPDVDHFAPKGEVHELPDHPDDRGREIHDGLPNIRGRSPAGAIKPGYWWLAYDWSNFLLVCGVCNRKWKQNYFPVAATPRQRPPVPGIHEQPLLLHPFDDRAPWRSFSFDQNGQIQGTDSRGKATVETCGLDRETLRKKRACIVRDARRHALAFRRQPTRDALVNLCEPGGDERDFAGAVRAIAEQLTGLAWERLCFLRENWPEDTR